MSCIILTCILCQIPALCTYHYAYPYAVDAAYEVLQKRTVLAMGLLMLVYIPFLVGILLMYRQLENPPSLNTAANNTSDSESSESSDSDDIGAVERKQLVPI